MSPLAQLDLTLEQFIRQITLRILSLRSAEFEAVWESANRICDRYDLAAIAARHRPAI